jgi:hypothetical protein
MSCVGVPPFNHPRILAFGCSDTSPLCCVSLGHSSELDASRQELLHLKKSMSTIVKSQHKVSPMSRVRVRVLGPTQISARVCLQACLAETQADFERLQQVCLLSGLFMLSW